MKKRVVVRPLTNDESKKQRRALVQSLRQDHPDYLIRNVVAKAPNGRWMTFDTLLQAKTIILPDHHLNIYQSSVDFVARCPETDKRSLREKFKVETDEEVYELLQDRAYNPYRAHGYEIEKELQIGNQYNAVKRARRRLLYKFNVPVKTEMLKQAIVHLPPQAQVIVDIIEIACSTRSEPTFSEDELQGIVEKHGFMLHTKQDPWRIFQYYRGKLIASGVMRLSR